MKSRWITLSIVGLGLMMFAPFMGARGQAADAPDQPKTIVRVYDVRDLLNDYPDFILGGMPRAAAFAIGPDADPSSVGQPEPSGNALFGQNVLFCGGAPVQTNVAPDRKATDLKNAIEEIAPNTWTDKGGAQADLHEVGGILCVRQTPENQKLIGDFLNQMSDQMSAMVRTEADWVWLPVADVAKLLKPAGKDPSAMAVKEVDPAALRALSPGVRHLHVEVMGRNGQAVYVVSGAEHSMVTNLTPVIGYSAVAFSANITTVAGGAALQVKPLAKTNRGYAMVTLYGTYDEPGAPRHASVSAVVASGYEPPTTQPTSDSAAFAAPSPRATTQPGAASTVSSFNTVGMKVQETHTTVRVPLGRPVIVEEATWDPTAKDRRPPLELVLILTETVVK